MRKYFMTLLSVGMLLSSAAPLVAHAAGKTYEGQGKGHNGDIKVEVTVDEGKITAIDVKDHQESKGISEPAFEQVPQAIIDGQTLAVETVSGATVSSKGIIEAVENALADSGLDMGKLKEKQATTEATPGEKVELTTEIVVVGGGIAGLAAAVEAQEQGKQVTLIEKMPALGGSTIRSGGEILAAGTDLQKANGVEDTADAFAEYMIEVGEGGVDVQFIHNIADNSAANIQWLIDHGVVFNDKVENTHSTLPDGRRHIVKDGGAGIIQPLADAFEKAGGKILKNTPAESLIEKDGQIVGVKATNDKHDDITIHAQAVILATGGFSRNEEMMKQYHPTLKNYSTGTGDGNVGDGIKMGEAVGGQLITHDSGIDLAVNPETFFGYGEEAKGLFVDPTGKRFMDESRFHFQRSRIMLENGFDTAYYIFSDDVYDDRVQKSIDGGFTYEADSIEDLAKAMDVDPAVLKETVDHYNELAKAGKDTDYDKDSEYLKPIEGKKYYAAKLMTSNSGTYGGLKITIKGEVVDKDDKPIPGLYAAGEVADGQIFNIGYPGSGTAIQSFLTIGRHAGDAASATIQ